jgi:type IV secretion system protein VirD4
LITPFGGRRGPPISITKDVLFYILGASACILGGIWISTQQIAALLQYPIEFGEPLFFFLEKPIYLPKFMYWWFKYGEYASEQFEATATACTVGALLGITFIVVFAFFRLSRKKEATSHGTARWATDEEIRKSGLLGREGVVLGLTAEGRYLRHDDSQHILCMAPTRSGKGVGIIIPTLLVWKGSVLVTDIKGENWGYTAGFRQKYLHNVVLKFDPTDDSGASAKFNPLQEIRIRTRSEVRDTQNLADILVDPQGTGQLDHWAKTGHALLVGVALHLLYINENAALSDIATFLSDPTKSFEETLDNMKTYDHVEDEGFFQTLYGVRTRIHPIVAQAAQELLNKSDNERSGVLSTAMSFLGLYRDPIVASNTAYSTFKIADLMNHNTPVSLYLVVPPSDINRTRPLVRMILNLVVRQLTEKMEFADGKAVKLYKHRLLLLLDEFPALGRLDSFEAALAFIAGYGLKALLIVQSLNQLNKTYTNQNSIVDNCHIRIVYTPNDEKTPEFIVKLLGTKTEVIENKSYQSSFMRAMPKNITVSTQESARALLTPGELGQFPADEEIVLVAGMPPIRARKVKYYQDKNFKKRLLNAPEKSDMIYERVESFISKSFGDHGRPQKESQEHTTLLDDFYAYDEDYEIDNQVQEDNL